MSRRKISDDRARRQASASFFNSSVRGLRNKGIHPSSMYRFCESRIELNQGDDYRSIDIIILFLLGNVDIDSL